MALRFIDSFDHYATADLLKKWSTNPIGLGGSSIAAGGRSGSGGMWVKGGGANTYLTKNIDSQQTWIMGCAINFSSVGANNSIFGLRDTGTLQCDVRMTTGSVLTVTRNGTVIGTGTTVLSAGVWYYIELKVKIDNTVGTWELRINGVTDISGSGDTQNSPNATANTITIGDSANQSGAPQTSYCDLYVCDGTGSAPTNDFLGDVRVEASFPNGSGNYSQFTGSDGNQVNNYQQVDETVPNSDTDYNQDSTVNDIDTYQYTDVTPTTGTIFGVQILPFIRKTDAGARSIRTVARLSSTDALDAADIPLSTSYTYYASVRETKPGGGAWTLADVNSAEFGVKITV